MNGKWSILSANNLWESSRVKELTNIIFGKKETFFNPASFSQHLTKMP